MPAGTLIGRLTAFACLFMSVAMVEGQPAILLNVQRGNSGVELGWPTSLTSPTGGVVFPEYELQRSDDLVRWEPIGGKVRGIQGLSGQRLTSFLPNVESKGFYRVLADLSADAGQITAQG